MNAAQPTRVLAALALAGTLGACASGPQAGASPTGTFQVALSGLATVEALRAPGLDAARPGSSLSGYSHLIVNLDRVELVSETGTQELPIGAGLTDTDGDGHPDLDLMALNSSATGLVDGPVPAGTYTQFRLFAPHETGPDAQAVYLVRTDGSHVALRVPSGQQTGLKVVVNGGLQVNVAATTTLNLAFDLKHSLVQTGNGRMMLKPVVHATGDVTSGAAEGTLTLPGGGPAAGTLTVTSGDTTVATASADAAGHYALPVLPAPAAYTFTASFTNAAGVVYTLGVPDVNVAANATTPEDLTFPPTGGLQGSLTLAGQPLAGATVEARPAGQPDATPSASATSDAAGAYTLPTLAPGHYDLTVSAPGAATGTDQDLTVTDGTLTTANLDLTAAP